MTTKFDKNRNKPKTAVAVALALISLSALAFCLSPFQTGPQKVESKPLDLYDLLNQEGFAPIATEGYNRKAETFWYKGASRVKTARFFHGYSEVNYVILRFASPKAMRDWDARFARIGIRGGWRAGDVFTNAQPMKPNVVSDSPGFFGLGLIALHLDFSVGNTVFLVGGNQHKSQARDGAMAKGVTDAQLSRTVQAVAQELKRQASSPAVAKSPL